MIINKVQARNLLKYAELEIDDLPERGIIAISGENESGKSSIGEAICFALFGRTFAHDDSELQKILRWGESRCSVVIEFTVDQTRYQLGRFLDRDGNMGARLALAERPDETLVRGPRRVAERLYEILGYEFDEFIDSFYLAQREITTPHPHSVAVKTMAGLAPLEQVADDFRREIEEGHERLEEIDAEVEALRQEQEELDFEEGLLIRLEDHRNEEERRLNETRDRRQALADAAQAYQTHWPHYRKAGRRRRRAGLLGWLSLLAAAVFGGAWALLQFQPGLPESRRLAHWLHALIPNWQSAWVPWLGLGALGLLVVAILFWLRAGYHRNRMAAARSELEPLGEALQAARAVPPAPEEAVALAAAQTPAQEEEDDEETPQTAEPAAETPTATPPERPDDVAHARLLVAVRSLEATPEAVATQVGAELAWLDHQMALEKAWVERLDQDVDVEIERIQQMARLAEAIAGLEQKEEEIRAGQARRRLAIELLEGAARDLSHDFNRDVRELVARTLPIFTQERYQHLRIDPDLSVKVFSSDKHDFLSLDEVSSGTQRQIMLALRLALSQKLLARRVKGYQFAFLDEPFAFFDEERTRHALQALTGLSEQLSQLWIVAQAYPEGADVDFAHTIHCQRGLDVLRA